MNSWLRSRIAMSCGIHTCPRKCHNPRDHKGLECAVRVQMELPCGHKVSRRCSQSKTPDSCFKCEATKQKAELAKKSEEKEAGIKDQPSTPVRPRSPTPPASPTSSRRDQHAAATTDNRTWRPGRSTYRGPHQSTDTDKNELFGRPKPQPGPFYSSRGGFGGGNRRK